jgi:hypothetical protein
LAAISNTIFNSKSTDFWTSTGATHAEKTGHKKARKDTKRSRNEEWVSAERQQPDMLKPCFSLRIFALFVAIMFSV